MSSARDSVSEPVYPHDEAFPGTISRIRGESRPAWPSLPQAPAGAPNIVVVVLDDVGFAALGCFGGLGGRVRTPNIDRLASNGLRYNNFHVSPMCSPTRAALLTGRNSHSVGAGRIMEMTSGFPGYHGRIGKDTAMLPAILATRGYATVAIGKWHLAPVDEVTPLGPFDRWPLGQGFQRFYGFLEALADQWNPVLWEDNHCIGRPAQNKPGYHLSEDLVDHAIAWCDEHDAVAPSMPFFLYVAFGATHHPHHVGEQWIAPYAGEFSAGWDVIRAETLEQQKQMGLVPRDTVLPPRNGGVPAWSSIDMARRRLLERQMEVYAAFLTHTDAQVGRLVAALERQDHLDGTLLMLLSDNGASGEGGPYGQLSTIKLGNGLEEPIEEKIARLDEWGQPSSFPLYASGWAMTANTPNRWYKRFTHEGGTRAPLIIHWPNSIRPDASPRCQFHAAVDIVPTILEAAGIEMPCSVNGISQRPLEGTSLAYTFRDPDAPTRKVQQYFEMFGSRAMWSRGWKAVCPHWTTDQYYYLGRLDYPTADEDLDRDEWELYNLDNDYSESHDLSTAYPERLRGLIELWWSEAGRYQVLPIDDRGVGFSVARVRGKGLRVFEERNIFRYHGSMEVPQSVTPNLRGHTSCYISARFELTDERGGVLVADGGREGGYVVCVLDGKLYYVENYLGREISVASAGPLAPGSGVATVSIAAQTGGARRVSVSVNEIGGETTVVPRVNPVRYDTRGGGLCIGSDVLGVWSRYEPPFVFPGSIDEVLIVCDDAKVPSRINEANAAVVDQ